MQAKETVARPLPKDTLWVRFVFVDHAGIPKAKAVHRDGFAGRARAGVGLAKGVLALDPSRGSAPGVGSQPGRGVPSDPRPLDANLVALRPRSGDGLLRHDGAGRGYPVGGMPAQRPQTGTGWALGEGLQVGCSYEAEFYVWDADGPLDRTPYAGSYALTPAAEFVAELARTLQEMGNRPEQVHAKVGQGNLELSVGEDEALRAADKRVMVLEAIRGVAHGMGLQTTMAPKPYLEGAGTATTCT